jgi:hypothetical protein
MAKVTFWCDTGANIHSCKEEAFDTVKNLGMAEGEWERMNDLQKEKEVYEWAQQHFDFGWKEE